MESKRHTYISTVAYSQQYPSVISIGSGDWIITWSDARNGGDVDIYAQRVNATGIAQWTTNGLAMPTTSSDQVTVQVTSDCTGGAIMAWEDFRNGNCDIYAQHLDRGGTLPIQIASFICLTNTNDFGVKLVWSTISEINNYGFYVERKFECEQNFTEIPNSFIAGHGTTTEPQEYSFVDNTITKSGIYQYRLQQVDNDGLVHYSQVVSVNLEVLSVHETTPIEFKVQQNYPNPFNPKATIKFSVDKVEHATVVVYDILGKQVAKLFDGVANPGIYYKLEFDGSALSSGIYFYKVTTDNHSELKKLVLLK
jgi:hypothetical protein